MKPDGRVRSRLVVKDFKQGGGVGEGMEYFSPTPSQVSNLILEAWALEKGHKMQMMDVSAAFMHSELQEEVYVKPPPEAEVAPGHCWRLKKAMHGLRSAAKSWQDHAANILKKLNYTRSQVDPCLYVHKDKDAALTIHVDDLNLAGTPEKRAMTIAGLAEQLIIKSTKPLEPGDSFRVLGFHKSIGADGSIHTTIDQNHIKSLKEIVFNNCPEGKAIKGSGIPGTKVKNEAEEQTPLSPEKHAAYRKALGILQWISKVRGDIKFSVKELGKDLAKPSEGSWTRLKKLTRYLISSSDVGRETSAKVKIEEVKCFTDSDWAGGTATRRSTSGGIIALGPMRKGGPETLENCAVIAEWSKTQPTIAQSSGEAETYAVVKGTSESLFCKAVL